ncbi:MAG: glycosyltransferase family 39 protein [Gemmatimonadaceae bacterium]|nr:glycosyltransferase family 39 protein [Gemmatimonadaceae bacterium]
MTEAPPPPTIGSTPRPRLATRTIAAFAAVKVALHMVVLAITPYGLQRDEFLYFAMGDHLRFWRMDFPPFIAIMANLQTALFGHTPAAARVFPALEGTVVLVLAAVIARELGGGAFAQGLAALSVLCGGIFLRPSNLFQPVVLDQLWWTLSLYALLRVGRASTDAAGPHGATSARRWWIAFGLAMGLGLLTKFSILFLGLAALGALIATPLRRWLATPWPYTAAAIAFAIGSASIVGQIVLGYPVVGQMHDLAASQLVHVSWLTFVAAQPFMIGFAAWPLAVAGGVALVAWTPLRPYRAAGWACGFAFLILLALHGKAYYIGPIYPTLLAAGAVWLERMGAPPARSARPAVSWAVAVVILLEGAFRLPIALPMLSKEATAQYAVRNGMEWALGTNRGGTDLLPQDFADQLGWRHQAATVARVYHALTPEEQRVTVITGGNYGEAGAEEFYAGQYGLPPVVCACGSYWFFGPGSRPGKVLIAVRSDSAQLASVYGDVRLAARIRSPWSVEEERDVRIWVARDQKRTLQAVWPRLARRN